MPPTFREQLERLRVAAATGVLPPDLARWALETIGDQGEAAERIERRNELLRAAAARMSGSAWAKARRLAAEVRALALHPRLRVRAADDDGVRALVARALRAGPAPGSVRQLFRVLTD